MSVALNRENYVLHRIHSITGIVPVGFYMLQHLTLNTFSLAGPEKFNSIIDFFNGLPKHILLGLEVVAIWIPLFFHMIYGFFIAMRADSNYSKGYKFNENRMFTFQRYTGIYMTFFLLYHMLSTSALAKVRGEEFIKYASWAERLSQAGYLILVVYLLGVLTSSYHLAYGVWNFAVRWGITISDRAQKNVQKFSMAMFVVVTLMGWAALGGFFLHRTPAPTAADSVPISAGSTRT